MTIIIAGICRDKVVMLGDRLNMIEEEMHEQESSKIYCINKSICVGIAGSSGYESEVLENIEDEDFTVRDIFERLKKIYKDIRMKLIKERLLNRFGVESIEDLKVIIGESPEIITYYLDEIKNFDPDIKILGGGVDSIPHIFAIGNPGMGISCDEVGFYAIGTGEKEATMMLNFLNYGKNLPMKTCILYLYIAKKAAEIAVGVGNKTDIFVISKDGVERVNEKDYNLMFQSWINGLEKIGGEKE